MEQEYEVILDGGGPWGFRLQGGKDFGIPLNIARITPGSKAAMKNILAGDTILEINGTPIESLTHMEAQNVIKNSGSRLALRLRQGKGISIGDQNAAAMGAAAAQPKVLVSTDVTHSAGVDYKFNAKPRPFAFGGGQPEQREPVSAVREAPKPVIQAPKFNPASYAQKKKEELEKRQNEKVSMEDSEVLKMIQKTKISEDRSAQPREDETNEATAPQAFRMVYSGRDIHEEVSPSSKGVIDSIKERQREPSSGLHSESKVPSRVFQMLQKQYDTEEEQESASSHDTIPAPPPPPPPPQTQPSGPVKKSLKGAEPPSNKKAGLGQQDLIASLKQHFKEKLPEDNDSSLGDYPQKAQLGRVLDTPSSAAPGHSLPQCAPLPPDVDGPVFRMVYESRDIKTAPPPRGMDLIESLKVKISSDKSGLSSARKMPSRLYKMLQDQYGTNDSTNCVTADPAAQQIGSSQTLPRSRHKSTPSGESSEHSALDLAVHRSNSYCEGLKLDSTDNLIAKARERLDSIRKKQEVEDSLNARAMSMNCAAPSVSSQNGDLADRLRHLQERYLGSSLDQSSEEESQSAEDDLTRRQKKIDNLQKLQEKYTNHQPSTPPPSPSLTFNGTFTPKDNAKDDDNDGYASVAVAQTETMYSAQVVHFDTGWTNDPLQSKSLVSRTNSLGSGSASSQQPLFTGRPQCPSLSSSMGQAGQRSLNTPATSYDLHRDRQWTGGGSQIVPLKPAPATSPKPGPATAPKPSPVTPPKPGPVTAPKPGPATSPKTAGPNSGPPTSPKPKRWADSKIADVPCDQKGRVRESADCLESIGDSNLTEASGIGKARISENQRPPVAIEAGQFSAKSSSETEPQSFSKGVTTNRGNILPAESSEVAESARKACLTQGHVSVPPVMPENRVPTDTSSKNIKKQGPPTTPKTKRRPSLEDTPSVDGGKMISDSSRKSSQYDDEDDMSIADLFQQLDADEKQEFLATVKELYARNVNVGEHDIKGFLAEMVRSKQEQAERQRMSVKQEGDPSTSGVSFSDVFELMTEQQRARYVTVLRGMDLAVIDSLSERDLLAIIHEMFDIQAILSQGGATRKRRESVEKKFQDWRMRRLTEESTESEVSDSREDINGCDKGTSLRHVPESKDNISERNQSSDTYSGGVVEGGEDKDDRCDEESEEEIGTRRRRGRRDDGTETTDSHIRKSVRSTADQMTSEEVTERHTRAAVTEVASSVSVRDDPDLSVSAKQSTRRSKTRDCFESDDNVTTSSARDATESTAAVHTDSRRSSGTHVRDAGNLEMDAPASPRGHYDGVTIQRRPSRQETVYVARSPLSSSPSPDVSYDRSVVQNKAVNVIVGGSDKAEPGTGQRKRADDDRKTKKREQSSSDNRSSVAFATGTKPSGAPARRRLSSARRIEESDSESDDDSESAGSVWICQRANTVVDRYERVQETAKDKDADSPAQEGKVIFVSDEAPPSNAIRVKPIKYKDWSQAQSSTDSSSSGRSTFSIRSDVNSRRRMFRASPSVSSYHTASFDNVSDFGSDPFGPEEENEIRIDSNEGMYSTIQVNPVGFDRDIKIVPSSSSSNRITASGVVTSIEPDGNAFYVRSYGSLDQRRRGSLSSQSSFSYAVESGEECDLPRVSCIPTSRRSVTVREDNSVQVKIPVGIGVRVSRRNSHN